MASGKSAWSDDWTGEWQDRVAGKDEPIEPRYVDIEITVDDAIDMARTVIECTLGPVREMLATLPAAIGGAWSSGRHRRRHRRRRRSWPPMAASWDA